MIFSLILFLCIGIVSANENGTATDDIKDLIDECEDNGSIKLEEKTYYLNPDNDTHITLNKSISIEGSGKTVIDGNNKTLTLDAVEKDRSDPGFFVVIPAHELFVKNTRKHIPFKNITFNDLNIISLHEMEFIDCKFIKTNFTSKELNNTFENCIFNESKIELYLIDLNIYDYLSKMMNCTIYNSIITSKEQIFLQIGESPRIFIKNRVNITDSRIFNSNVSLNHNNMTISNSKFENSNLKGCCDTINIANTTFNNPEIGLDYTEITFKKSNLTNATFDFKAGYYTKGCDVAFKNSTIENSTLNIIPNIESQKSNLTIQNSSVNICEIKPADTNVRIDNSNFNKSTIELFFSNLNITNATFYSDGDIKDTIKTKTETETYSTIN